MKSKAKMGKKTRREFLASASALGVGVLAPPVWPSVGLSDVEALIRRAGNAEDEKKRYWLLRSLQKRPGGLSPAELREELDALLPLAYEWAFGREQALAQLEEQEGHDPHEHPYLVDFFDRDVTPPREGSPLRPMWALYEGRMIIWRVIQYGNLQANKKKRRALLGKARSMLRVAQEAFPENRILGMYLGDPIPWPAGFEADPEAPAWANLQREGLEKTAGIVRWWIRNRQLPNGEYGGAWGDDVEMWRWQAPVVIGFQTPEFADAQARLSRGVFELPRMEGGYLSDLDRQADVEHTAEWTADTITPMMHLRPEDPTWKGRAKRLGELMRGRWMGRNERGLLQFKSAYLFESSITMEPPRATCDTVYHFRVAQPLLLYWQRTGDEQAGDLLTDWLDTWVDATARAERGKPAGVAPSAIHWPDGRVGGVGDDWWAPMIMPENDYYWWPSAMSSLTNALLLGHFMTGEEKYLQPIRSMAEIWEQHGGSGSAAEEAPEPGTKAWCARQMDQFLPGTLGKYRALAGDAQFDDLLGKGAYVAFRFRGDRDPLMQGLRENADALGQNRPAFTSEMRWTDRVFSFTDNYRQHVSEETLPEPRPGLLYSAVTGDPGGVGYFPMNAVRWLTRPRRIAALVTDAGSERFEAELYHFGDAPRPMGARWYLLEEGSYKMQLTGKSGESLMRRTVEVKGPSAEAAFELPPRTLCRLHVARSA
jgi:hypothetical protein